MLGISSRGSTTLIGPLERVPLTAVPALPLGHGEGDALHTNVPTTDTRILPGGPAYQTDVGMTGPYDSACRFAAKERRRPELHAVIVTVDETTGKAAAIHRYTVS